MLASPQPWSRALTVFPGLATMDVSALWTPLVAPAIPSNRRGRIAMLLSALWCFGCSENFGTPPAGVAPAARVVAQGFAGPTAVRAITALRGRADLLWVGTDRGAYRVVQSGADLAWRPGPPDASLQAIVAIDGDVTGSIWIVQSRLVEDALHVSYDRGRSFRQVARPATVAGVDRIAALPRSPAHPFGALAVVQGTALFVRAQETDSWTPASLPAAPQAFGPLAADGQGRVALAVQTPGGWQFWRSIDGGSTFTASGASPEGPVLSVALLPDGALSYATPARIVGPGASVLAPSGSRFERADVRARGAVVDYVAQVDDGSAFAGMLPGPSPTSVAASAGVGGVEGPVAVEGGGYVVSVSGELERVFAAGVTPVPFAGGILDFGSAAADPRAEGVVVLGRVGGEVYRGDAADAHPDFLDTPQLASFLTVVLPDRGDASGVFWGAFGAQWHPGLVGEPWDPRSAGLDDYANPGQPFQVSALAQEPGHPERLWLGGADGNGVYRSTDSGRSWSRVHGGLGYPGVLESEHGLSGATQIRRFVFVGTQIWMGAFRGGVYALEAATDTWEQHDRGLPDALRGGLPLDTCCIAPPTQAVTTIVDVRDLAALPDGALLAATGFGVYRDDARTGDWHPSGQGLGNGDVYVLAPHPTRSGWVLAGCRGTAGAPAMLFLSRDAGRSWAELEVDLAARWVEGLAWSDPEKLEVVAVLDRSGAWRMELLP